MKKFIAFFFVLISVMVFSINAEAQSLRNRESLSYSFDKDTLKGADSGTFLSPILVDGSYDYSFSVDLDSVNHSEAVTAKLYEYNGSVWGKVKSFTITSNYDTVLVGQCYGMKQKIVFSQAADTTIVDVGLTYKKRN